MSKQGAPQGEKGAEHPPKEEKKPAGGGANHAPSTSTPSRGSGNVGAKVGCHATSCKAKDVRYNFCEEHFRQYKFGLINKSGQQVSDFERKFEHYQNWLKAQKVA